MDEPRSDHWIAEEAIRLIKQDQQQAARQERELRDRDRVAAIEHEQLLLYRGRHRARKQFELELVEEDKQNLRLRLGDGERFLYDQLEDLPPVWGEPDRPAWSYGESLMMFGPPGIGKSTLSHLLVWGRLGLVHQVLSWPVHDDGGRVLYVAADRPRQISRGMRRLVQHWPEQQIRQVLRDRLVVHYGPLPVDICQDRHWLPDLADQNSCTTVVIDSVKDLCTRPSDEELAAGYNLARQEAVARGIQWLENHHGRKSNADNKTPNRLDDVYGSRWLTAGAGSVLCLWGEPGDPAVDLRQLKAPAEFIDPCQLVVNFGLGTVELRHQGDPLLQWVQSNGGGVTAADAARFLGETRRPRRADVEAARNRLNRLVHKGQLRDEQGPDLLVRWFTRAQAEFLDVRLPTSGPVDEPTLPGID